MEHFIGISEQNKVIQGLVSLLKVLGWQARRLYTGLVYLKERLEY